MLESQYGVSTGAGVWQKLAKEKTPPARCRGFFSMRSVCGLGEEPEAAQIILGPSGGLQDAPKGLAGEGVAAGMVVDAGQSAVRVAVDPAAGLGLALQRKAVSSQGGDKFPYGCVAEEVDKLAQIVGHRLTATTGASIVSTA